MKRFMMMLLLVMATMGANAQTIYKVTGTNVNVRSGPGKNYSVLTFYGYDGDKKWQLDKTDKVRYLGKKQNGFMYIEAFMPSGGSATPDLEKGWVSAQYLKLAKKCTNCNGMGFFNRPCRAQDGSPNMHTYHCDCQSCRLHSNCGGKQHCHKCYGWGYL